MYEYFDHPADIGIKGIGNSFEESFCESAKAVMNIMADINSFVKEFEHEIEVTGSDREFLFVNFLNKMILEANFLRAIWVDVEIRKMEENYLIAKLYGEKIKTHHKNHLKVEVKAATFCELKVFKDNDKFISQCVVDI